MATQNLYKIQFFTLKMLVLLSSGDTSEKYGSTMGSLEADGFVYGLYIDLGNQLKVTVHYLIISSITLLR